ncbi:MAG: threonylcarbamoyl-AMP synthase [Isosphaeraceae bacterium]|jgi:L-threonylcarbamoyladenylate synthase|nr:MAG: threonylcarbamoyl-AMP synthase [Isosphaeraceae bacterium]
MVDGRTRVLRVGRSGEDLADAAAIGEAAEVLRRGGLVAFPTETVYGLGADATNPSAVREIFEAKGRPATNPLIVHGADEAAVRWAVAEWPEWAGRLAAQFWPGPLTLVLPRSERVAEEVTAGLGTVGVRVPDHRVALALLRTLGRPIAAPSANRSTGVSPTAAEHVLADLEGRVDLVLDAGRTAVGIESTVVDVTGRLPRILRPGVIGADWIGEVLGVEVEVVEARRGGVGDEGPMTSPGQMEVHYAPRAEVRLIDPEAVGAEAEVEGSRAALLVVGRPMEVGGRGYGEVVCWRDPVVAARELYATLREWDERGVERVDVVLPELGDERWRAVRDRLWRASRRVSGSGLGGGGGRCGDAGAR